MTLYVLLFNVTTKKNISLCFLLQLLYPARAAVEEWDNLEERHPSPLGNGKTMGTIYVTSYETAVAIRSMLVTVNWNYIVVDEGHR